MSLAIDFICIAHNAPSSSSNLLTIGTFELADIYRHLFYCVECHWVHYTQDICCDLLEMVSMATRSHIPFYLLQMAEIRFYFVAMFPHVLVNVYYCHK